MVKSLAQYTNEIDRINEWLFNNKGNNIIDKGTFDLFYKDEIADGRELSPLEKAIREEAFKKYQNQHRIESRDLHKEAGGKDLRRDRKTTAKKVVTDKEEFIKLGARKSDLKNLDTGIFGIRGKKIVRIAQITKINRKGKDIIVFRDKRGRFVKRK